MNIEQMLFSLANPVAHEAAIKAGCYWNERDWYKPTREVAYNAAVKNLNSGGDRTTAATAAYLAARDKILEMELDSKRTEQK